MEGRQIARGRERSRKTTRETIKKDLEINYSERDMICMIQHYNVI